jgi:hypothetical protein
MKLRELLDFIDKTEDSGKEVNTVHLNPSDYDEVHGMVMANQRHPLYSTLFSKSQNKKITVLNYHYPIIPDENILKGQIKINERF